MIEGESSPQLEAVTLSSLYRRYFGRPPDQEGLASNQIAVERGRTLVETEIIFSQSDEYKSRVSELAKQDPAKAAEIMFRSLLGRPPDHSGNDHYQNRLRRGDPPVALIEDIQNSPEFRGHSVKRLYQELLHRPADEIGLKDKLQSGKSVIEIADKIRNSDEYKPFGIDLLYQNLLGRHVDESGLRDKLIAGTSLKEIKQQIEASVEYRRKKISELYRNILRREPDKGGLTSKVTSGKSIDEVEAEIFSSDEYTGFRRTISHQSPQPIPEIEKKQTLRFEHNPLRVIIEDGPLAASNHQKFRPISRMEGMSGGVVIRDTTVEMSPTDFSKSRELRQKMENEKLFKKLTAGVTGLYHPKIITEDATTPRYVIERAQGSNLTNFAEFTQGLTNEDFIQLPTELKVKGVLTYLKAVSALNRAGYSFVDHKLDSVFLDHQKLTISIVDAGSIAEDKYAWSRELSGGLSDVLQGFFIKGNTERNNQFLIPGTLRYIFDHLKDYQSADKLIKEIESWQQGKNLLDKRNRYSILGYLVYGYQLSQDKYKLIYDDKISELGDYEFDRLETHIHVEGFIRSGEFKGLDKFIASRQSGTI